MNNLLFVVSVFITILFSILLAFEINYFNEWQLVFIASVFNIIIILNELRHENVLKKWQFWLYLIFFAFYLVGPLMGHLFIDIDGTYINYQWSFSQNIRLESRIKTFQVIILTLSLVYALIKIINIKNNKTKQYLKKEEEILKLSLYIMGVTLPFIVYGKLYTLNYVINNTFTDLYVMGGVTVFPFYSLISNANLAGFYLWCSALPNNKKQILIVFSIYFAFSMIDSLTGDRSAIMLFAIFSIWYLSYINILKIKIINVLVTSIFALGIIFILGFTREEQEIDWSLLLNFFVYNLSTASMQLAVFFNNLELIEDAKIFALAPLVFPYYYLFYGEEVLGQNQLVADLGFDINHFLSSRINIDAYLSGSGMGANMISEAYQYGLISLYIFIFAYILQYKIVFSMMDKNRLILFISPYVFFNLIMSPRDHLYMHTWGLLKYITVFVIINIFLKIFKSKSIKNNKL